MTIEDVIRNETLEPDIGLTCNRNYFIKKRNGCKRVNCCELSCDECDKLESKEFYEYFEMRWFLDD